VGISEPFVNGLDPIAKYFVGDDGIARCSNRFSIFVTAQQIVRVGKQVSHVLTPIRGTQDEMHVNIYATRKLAPRYSDEEEIVQLGTVIVDLTPVMSRGLDERSVEVSMFFGETELRVQAEVVLTGESVEAVVEFESLS
jgi:hypothetical protein